ERIGEGPWLSQLDDVSVGHGVSLLWWRSGGVEHPHDTPPYPFMPSPTSAHSSLACVTAQLMGATPRFHAIIALLTMREKYDPEFAGLVKKTNALLQRSYEVAEQRNRIVHDRWFMETRTRRSSQLRSMPRKEPDYGFKPVSRRHLETVLDKIADFSARVNEFGITIFDARTASLQRRHAERSGADPSSAPPDAQ